MNNHIGFHSGTPFQTLIIRFRIAKLIHTVHFVEISSIPVTPKLWDVSLLNRPESIFRTYCVSKRQSPVSLSDWMTLLTRPYTNKNW